MTQGAPARWRALDAFRGLAIVGMLLVNNPGDHDAVYAQLRHSPWHGLTFADLVFPFFLFVVGITTEMTVTWETPVPRIARRAAIIFGIGLLLNWFPFYQSGPIPWTDHPAFVDRVAARLAILRIPGVLQRIALCYLVVALLLRRASTRAVAVIAMVILAAWWAALTLGPVPGEGLRGAFLLDQPARTLPAHVDRALFDWSRWGLGNHLWDSAGKWDPEGLLSSLASVSTVLLGALAGRWMRVDRERKLLAALVAGACVLALGAAWNVALPLNKALWTSSYALLTAGISLVVLTMMTWWLARAPDAGWARPLIVFGENPLVAYVGSELGRRVLHSSIRIPTTSGSLGIDAWVTRLLARLGGPPELTSLLWALLYVGAWYLALRGLSRRRLLVRA